MQKLTSNKNLIYADITKCLTLQGACLVEHQTAMPNGLKEQNDKNGSPIFLHCNDTEDPKCHLLLIPFTDNCFTPLETKKKGHT